MDVGSNNGGKFESETPGELGGRLVESAAQSCGSGGILINDAGLERRTRIAYDFSWRLLLGDGEEKYRGSVGDRRIVLVRRCGVLVEWQSCAGTAAKLRQKLFPKAHFVGGVSPLRDLAGCLDRTRWLREFGRRRKRIRHYAYNRHKAEALK